MIKYAVLHTPKWWNWHTQGTQNPPGPRAHAGSTPAFGTIFLLLTLLIPSSIFCAQVLDRIVADVNGEIVAASEILEWRALEPDLTDDQALQKIIREKLRLQDIARHTLYHVENADLLAALHGAALADTQVNRRAFRRKLVVQRFVLERFEALVSVSDTQVRTTLKESFPDLAEPDPAQPEWEKARKLLETRELERMIEEWDRKLAEKAKIRWIAPAESK